MISSLPVVHGKRGRERKEGRCQLISVPNKVTGSPDPVFEEEGGGIKGGETRVSRIVQHLAGEKNKTRERKPGNQHLGCRIGPNVKGKRKRKKGKGKEFNPTH